MLAALGLLPEGILLGGTNTQNQGPKAPANGLSDADDQFLEDLGHASFEYFWEQANPETGIVRDRCNAIKPSGNDLGSIAAVGFGLTALCIGDQRGWVSHNEAKTRALNTMRFLWKKMPNHREFFYHWANINTGER